MVYDIMMKRKKKEMPETLVFFLRLGYRYVGNIK